VTLLVREVGRYVALAALWAAVLVLISVATVAVVSRAFRTTRRPLYVPALVGAATAAGLAVRFGFPLAWAPTIGTRPVPLAWSILGAAVGSLLVLWRLRADTPNVATNPTAP
jgi:hypothetical protein